MAEEIKDIIFILNEKQETVGIATNSSPHSLPYYGDIHNETLTGISNYEFIVPANHEESSKLTVNGHIIRQVFDGNYMLFTIKEITTDNDGKNTMTIYCENSAISELLEDVQRPSTLLSTSLENAVSSVLSNTLGWSVGYIGFEASRDIVFEDYTTVLEALKFIESSYGVEMYFTVELVGNKIVGKKVNLVKQRGENNGVRFEYGHNLRGVTRKEDSSGVITAIIVVGKGDSTKNRVNLSTLPAFNDGNFYKSTGSDWVGSNEALQRWSKDGSHIFGIHIDDGADTVSRLKDIAIKQLKERSVPKLHYASSVSRLEELTGYESKRVRLGDTILVLDRSFSVPLAVEGRIQSLEISYTDKLSSGFGLGNYKPISLSTPVEITRLQNTISLKEEEWKVSGITVEIESLGGNVFKNGVGSTTLNAKVFEGGREIDLDGTTYIYKWYKHLEDGSRSKLWGGSVDYRTGKSLTIQNIDVDSKATFIIELEKE